MTSAHKTIGVKWREDRRTWQIFGLLPDGRFYGEYIDLANSDGFKTLEGTVSSPDYRRMVSLVEKIKELPPRPAPEPRDADLAGLLYEGSRADPHIVFVRSSNAPAHLHDKFFAEIVEIMKTYCVHVTDG